MIAFGGRKKIIPYRRTVTENSGINGINRKGWNYWNGLKGLILKEGWKPALKSTTYEKHQN